MQPARSAMLFPYVFFFPFQMWGELYRHRQTTLFNPAELPQLTRNLTKFLSSLLFKLYHQAADINPNISQSDTYCTEEVSYVVLCVCFRSQVYVSNYLCVITLSWQCILQDTETM